MLNRKEKSMRIALTGNPNSGKTTMYNALTGRNEKVGNWAGVTVEKKESPIKKHFYSGSEELVVWRNSSLPPRLKTVILATLHTNVHVTFVGSRFHIYPL